MLSIWRRKRLSESLVMFRRDSGWLSSAMKISCLSLKFNDRNTYLLIIIIIYLNHISLSSAFLYSNFNSWKISSSLSHSIFSTFTLFFPLLITLTRLWSLKLYPALWAYSLIDLLNYWLPVKYKQANAYSYLR